MKKTAIAIAVSLVGLNAHAVRTTTDGGTEIDLDRKSVV